MNFSVFFSEYVFWVDKQNIYHRKKLYWVYVLVFIVTILYCYICIIVGNQKYQARFGVVNTLIFPSFGIGVQMIYSEIIIDFMCVAIDSFFCIITAALL